MSQRSLAQASGLEESHINHFVNGRREPNLTNLLKLCDGLKMSPNELLGRQPVEFMRVDLPVFVPVEVSLDYNWYNHLVNLGGAKP